jgi:hypothetical protein
LLSRRDIVRNRIRRLRLIAARYGRQIAVVIRPATSAKSYTRRHCRRIQITRSED